MKIMKEKPPYACSVEVFLGRHAWHGSWKLPLLYSLQEREALSSEQEGKTGGQ